MAILRFIYGGCFGICMDKAKQARIVMLRGVGFEQKEIAERLGVSQPTVHKYLKKMKLSAKERGAEIIFCEMFMHSPIDPDSIKAIAESKFRMEEKQYLEGQYSSVDYA